MKNNLMKYFLILMVIAVVIPQIALASWYNPFSWNWNNIWNYFFPKTQTSTFYKNTSQNQAQNPPVQKPTCSNLYWFDNTSSNNCQTQKQFCGAYMYYGLQTFSNKQDCLNAFNIARGNCIPNWKCGWGPCINGTQGQIAIDSNNCGLPSSSAKIACPALARVCGAPAAKETSCLNSGGTVETITCYCSSPTDFYNNCAIGGCTCTPNPAYARQIKTCNCGQGKCFDGNSCVAQKL